jgi:hypothetical protein
MHWICQEEPTHDMALIFHSFKMVLEKERGQVSLSLSDNYRPPKKKKNQQQFSLRKT